jgi:hypothetical protein
VRPLIENKSSVVLAPASSAYKHSLKEVLANPAIAGKIKNTKVRACPRGLGGGLLGWCGLGPGRGRLGLLGRRCGLEGWRC